MRSTFRTSPDYPMLRDLLSRVSGACDAMSQVLKRQQNSDQLDRLSKLLTGNVPVRDFLVISCVHMYMYFVLLF